MSRDEKTEPTSPVSRREFVNYAVAALGAAGYRANAGGATPLAGASSAEALKNSPRAPFDSLRDWYAALEAHGLLLRFKRIDLSLNLANLSSDLFFCAAQNGNGNCIFNWIDWIRR